VTDLIERLRSFVVERGKIACGSDIVSACNNSALSLSDLRALLAALEAARVDAEDAARYRWLRKGESDDVAVVRGLGAMDYGMSAVVYTYSEEIDGDDLDAAIDAAIDRARGKEAT
jgi:hypothetical protein